MPKANGNNGHNGHASSANGSASKSPKKSRSKKTTPTTEAIQRRAYEIYLERNGAPGNPLEDWVRAESELLGKTKRAARKSPTTATAA